MSARAQRATLIFYTGRFVNHQAGHQAGLDKYRRSTAATVGHLCCLPCPAAVKVLARSAPAHAEPDNLRTLTAVIETPTDRAESAIGVPRTRTTMLCCRSSRPPVCPQ